MKVVEYWHETIKNYRYDGDVSEGHGTVVLRFMAQNNGVTGHLVHGLANSRAILFGSEL